MATKEWKGIQVNSCIFLGKIVGNPEIIPVANGNFIFMTLRTYSASKDDAGNWIETPIDVPLMVEPGSYQSKTAENYIQDGRELYVTCTYKNWMDENQVQQHKMMVTNIKLGSKPYVDPNNTQNAPNLPPS